MTTLTKTLQIWPGEDLKQTLKNELLALESGTLPLQQATTQGGFVNEEHLDLTILSSAEENQNISLKIGVFFTEIVGGCNCDDDPTETPAYCMLQLLINKTTASCVFTLLDE